MGCFHPLFMVQACITASRIREAVPGVQPLSLAVCNLGNSGRSMEGEEEAGVMGGAEVEQHDFNGRVMFAGSSDAYGRRRGGKDPEQEVCFGNDEMGLCDPSIKFLVYPRVSSRFGMPGKNLNRKPLLSDFL
ncbi:unnamed protein product [Pleuronectes platessa]|uniref:Uncharacterized protein n=1 Tax=Pleuronectes platessa TaxID=8262 RepID=A0A9N7VZP4_PLEPL|nr:unnamed protein product [Pleuronectes platessa]